MPLKHIVTLSYGISSWAAGKLVVEKFGAKDTILLNTDTKYEDEDTYKWGEAAAKNIGAPLVMIADGRDPWEVFRDERQIGNSRIDPCSKLLKRDMLQKWLKANCDPGTTIVYFGIHWSESDRFYRVDKKTGKKFGIKTRLWDLGWRSDAPLLWPPLLGMGDIHAWAEREGLWNQKLYRLGFPHANCGGRCVKQGQAGWKRLLETMPERYAEVEAKEEGMRVFLGKDISIMRDRSGGDDKTLTLRQLRERLEAKQECDETDWGGCGCFSGSEGE